MKSVVRIFLISLMIFNALDGLWEKNIGPFNVLFKKFTRCKNMGRNSFVYGTEIEQINSTYYLYSSNMTINFDISNEKPLRIIVKSKIKGSNKWSSLIDVTMKMCDAIERFAKDIITDLLNSAGEEYKCPISKRTYVIKDYVVNFNRFSNIPALPYGEITLEIILYSFKRNRKIVESCLKFDLELVPKDEIVKDQN